MGLTGRDRLRRRRARLATVALAVGLAAVAVPAAAGASDRPPPSVVASPRTTLAPEPEPEPPAPDAPAPIPAPGPEPGPGPEAADPVPPVPEASAPESRPAPGAGTTAPEPAPVVDGLDAAVATGEPGSVPRRLAVGQPSASRAVSAPPGDPLSLIERDGGLSVRLSDGKQLWLFADTAVVVNGTMTYFSGRGTGAISVGADPYTITEPSEPYGFLRHPSSGLIYGGDNICPPGYDDFYWPSSAVAVPQPGGGDTVFIYYQALCGTGGSHGTYYTVSMGLARYDYSPSRPPSVANPIRADVVNAWLFPPMPGHSGPGSGYGITSMLSNGSIVVYSCSYSPVWQSCRVGRVSPSQAAVASAYRFWDGADWVAGAANAVDLDMPNALIGIKGSVAYIASVGLYAFVDNDFPSSRIAVRWATRPEGPWTSPSFVTIPDCVGRDCWAAEVHANLSTGGNLALTYYADGMRPGMRAVTAPILVDPVGRLDPAVSSGPNRIDVSGWTVDPDVTDPIGVHVYLDGQFAGAVTADRPVASMPGAPPGSGPNHGFAWSAEGVAAGSHTVCAYGINVVIGAGQRNPLLGCSTIVIVAPAWSPVAATNGDGRLEVFAPDGSGGLSHAWQLTPGGVWSRWEPLFLTTRTQPTVAFNDDGRLEIFAVDGSGALIHTWQVPGVGWSGWQPMFTTVAGPVVVAPSEDGWLRIFATRSDGVLVTSRQVAGVGWWPWQSSGTTAAATPSLVRSADDRLEIFVPAIGGRLLHSWQTTRNGPFSPWRDTGTTSGRSPTAVRQPDGRLEVFATDLQDRVVHSWQRPVVGGWSTWEPMGLTTRTPVSVGVNQDARLELFALDAQGALQHAWQVPGTGWSSWEWMGLSLRTAPGVATNLDGRMALFAVTAGDQVLQANQVPGSGWSAFRRVTPGAP